MKKKKFLHERFEEKFKQKTGHCWEWTAGKDSCGYGKMIVREKEGYKMLSAHRYSYRFYNGPIPAGMSVLHTCDNRKCVNPNHLKLGTQRENVLDAIKKGRFPQADIIRKFTPPGKPGEKNPNCKLTEKIVQTIRDERKAGSKLEILSMKYGVSVHQISLICSGKSWANTYKGNNLPCQGESLNSGVGTETSVPDRVGDHGKII